MSNKRKFKCKSEAQKKVIAIYYAKKAKAEKGKKSSNVKKKKPVWAKGIRLGMTLSTYDEYLPHENDLKENKERPVVVIEKNNRDELAVVPLSTTKGRNRTHLPNYQQGQSYFKHFVEIEDNEGNSIVLNEKFRANNPDEDVSAEDLEKITRTVLFHSKPAPENSKKIESFRQRKNAE
ncbi:MAG: hypothetical protein IJZ04_05295 [Clostridia bacterium]|nr:hypothetical protein [Clostridia bacterium]MBQ8738896.1 hypothetical protein [Clostridia bacterium]